MDDTRADPGCARPLMARLPFLRGNSLLRVDLFKTHSQYKCILYPLNMLDILNLVKCFFFMNIAVIALVVPMNVPRCYISGNAVFCRIQFD